MKGKLCAAHMQLNVWPPLDQISFEKTRGKFCEETPFFVLLSMRTKSALFVLENYLLSSSFMKVASDGIKKRKIEEMWNSFDEQIESFMCHK